jgi:hypothetical protein
MTKTRFNDWKIDGYFAESPDGKYRLWVASGFLFFSDNEAFYPRETLITGIRLWQKYKIWREFCRERRNRADKFFKRRKRRRFWRS